MASMKIPPLNPNFEMPRTEPGSETLKADELNLLPPASLNPPLWRSLLENLRERFAPERLPPLHLTSRPVDVGMLAGDFLDLPWYRTVFTSLGDVITPETLPPLELESRPVDVGELLSDATHHPWWTSLLRNLADAVAPEKLPPMEVTAAPVSPEMASNTLLAPRWSALLTSPKVFLPDAPEPVYASPLPLSGTFLVGPPPDAEVDDEIEVMIEQVKRDLSHSRVREILWISVALAEVIVAAILKLR